MGLELRTRESHALPESARQPSPPPFLRMGPIPVLYSLSPSLFFVFFFPACYLFTPSSVSRMPFQVPSCVTSVFWGPLGSSTVFQGQPTGMLFLVPLLPPSNPACPQVLRCSSSMALTIPNTPLLRSILHPPTAPSLAAPGLHPPSWASPQSLPPQAARVSSSQAKPFSSHHPPSQHPPEAAPFVPSLSPYAASPV